MHKVAFKLYFKCHNNWNQWVVVQIRREWFYDFIRLSRIILQRAFASNKMNLMRIYRRAQKNEEYEESAHFLYRVLISVKSTIFYHAGVYAPK